MFEIITTFAIASQIFPIQINALKSVIVAMEENPPIDRQ